MRDATPCIAVYQPGKRAEKGSMLPNSLFFFDDPNTMPNMRDDIFRLRGRYLFPVRRELRADQIANSKCPVVERHAGIFIPFLLEGEHCELLSFV